MEEDSRLNRIEKKVDDIAQAMIHLTRIDERMVTLFKRIDTYETKQEAQANRIGELEKKVYSGAWVERVVWVLVAAGVGAIAKVGGVF